MPFKRECLVIPPSLDFDVRYSHIALHDRNAAFSEEPVSGGDVAFINAINPISE